MKKRIILLGMSLFAFLSLSGCGMIAKTGLSEGEMEQVAEYTAKLLLRHVRGYQPHLLEQIEVQDDPSLVKEEFEVLGKEKEKQPEEKGEAASETQKETEEPKTEEKEDPSEEMKKPEEGQEASNGSAKQLKDIYTTSGISVVYGGSGEFMKFPKDEGYFSLVPPEGMKLFVATMVIKNTSEKTVHYVHDNEIKYSLDFYKSGKTYKPSVTLLERDLKFLDVTLKAGESTSGVVVFNVPSSTKMEDVNLIIAGKGMKYEISVSQ